MQRRTLLQAASIVPLSIALPGLAQAKSEVPWDHQNLRHLYMSRPGVMRLILDVQARILDGLEPNPEQTPIVAVFYYLLYGEIYLYPHPEIPSGVAVRTEEPKESSNWVKLGIGSVLEPYYQRLMQDPGFDLDETHTQRAIESHVEKGVSQLNIGHAMLRAAKTAAEKYPCQGY